MNRTHRLLRTIALKTNPHWPFTHLNRLPYAAAIRAAAGVAKSHGEIRSLYLRHGLVETKWIPGLSDIDLTAIVRGDLTVDAECRFLDSFWSGYGRVKALFPMLGEVEILNQRELAPWMNASAYSPEPRRWTLLHGEAQAATDLGGGARWRQRGLRFGFWAYLELLQPCLAQPASFLQRQDMHRRARRVLKYIAPILADSGQPALPLAENADGLEALAHVLKALEAATACVTPVPLRSGRGVMRTPGGKTLVVLADGLEPGELQRLVEAESQPAATFLTHSLFAYMVREYSPFDYADLRQRGTPLSGADPLGGMDPPLREAGAAYTLDRIAGSLPQARGRADWTPVAAASQMKRAVTSLLLLRDGWTSLDRSEIAERCRAEFPESFAKLQEIERHAAEGRARTARDLFFYLLRPIVDQLTEAMCSTAGKLTVPK